MIITNYIFHYNEFNKEYVNNLNPEDNNIKKYIFFTLFSFMPFSNYLPKYFTRYYKSSSSHKIAMVNFERYFGIIFEERDVYDNIFKLTKNNEGKYEKITYK